MVAGTKVSKGSTLTITIVKNEEKKTETKEETNKQEIESTENE